MNDLVNIKDYTSHKILLPKKIYGFTLVLILTTLIIVAALFKINIDFYYKNTAFITQNNLIKTNIPSDKLKYVSNNNVININNKNYKYKVIEIGEPVVNPLDLSYYQEVLILVKNYKNLNHNFVDFKIKYNNKKLVKIVKEFILGKGN